MLMNKRIKCNYCGSKNTYKTINHYKCNQCNKQFKKQDNKKVVVL